MLLSHQLSKLKHFWHGMALHSNLRVLPQIEGGHRDYSRLVPFAGDPGALILRKQENAKERTQAECQLGEVVTCL